MPENGGTQSYIVTSGISGHPQYEPTRGDIERFLKQSDIPPYKRLNSEVNLANVEYVPNKDLLVLADSLGVPINRTTMKELTRVFGDPKNVIHLQLSAQRRNSSGAPLCYDLDLAFHATLNNKGESVALIHRPCIQESKTNKTMGANEVLSTLRTLGFRVIEIDVEDQQNLVRAQRRQSRCLRYRFPHAKILPPVSPPLWKKSAASSSLPSLFFLTRAYQSHADPMSRTVRSTSMTASSKWVGT